MATETLRLEPECAEIYGKPTNVLRESIAALNDPQILATQQIMTANQRAAIAWLDVGSVS
jgi:hypothetical protein